MKTPLILILSLALSLAANGAITILEDNWDDIGAGAQAWPWYRKQCCKD